MTPHEVVLNFVEMLNAGYPAWRRAATVAREREQGFSDEAFFDWAQACWELLVERPLCSPGEFLEIYGAGSDYETQSYCRVFFHDALPTHEIASRAASGSAVKDLLSGDQIVPEDCTFDRFVCRKGEWFADEPPFDHVLLLDRGKTELLVRLTDLHFTTRRLPT